MNNQPLDLPGAVWFIFGEGEKVADGKLVVFERPSEVLIRHTYVNETPQCVSFMKKRGGFESLPPPLYYQYPIPIKKTKAEELVSKYLPAVHRGFYP